MDYREKVFPVFQSTRELLVSNWGTAEVTHQKDGSATNVVTKIDTEMEERVSGQLKALFPDIGFVGEECGGDRSAERFWLMDPIDGTSHYVRGLPFCTSMLALIEQGVVTFSVVYDFLNDTFYWAQRGAGAFRDSARLQVSSRPLAQAYLSWETHARKSANNETFLALASKAVLFKTVSAGWEFAMVAAGKLEGRIQFDPWGLDYDFAAGSLLVAEAGGVVANLGVRTYDYRNLNFIAANPQVYQGLTQGPQALFPNP